MSSSRSRLALVVNSGSSSIKFGVFEMRTNASTLQVEASLACGGLVGRIGSEAEVKFSVGESTFQSSGEDIPDHAAGLARILGVIEDKVGSLEAVEVVGHRIVHGGPDFKRATVIDGGVEAAIEETAPLAPLHNPAGLLGVRVAKAKLPHAPHVAVFDTAFHVKSMSPEAYRYAVPRQLYELGVRRYGFHGTSYAYIARALPDVKNMIIFHLGNGASCCAVSRGECVETSMGLTPLEGLMMGTRCGDLDCGVVSYACRELGKTPAEVDSMLNKQSGLLGVSGVSSDMRAVREAAEAGNADAKLAREMYAERVRKYLGAYMVKLGGHVDAIVFTAGVGENDAGLREMVCRGLEPMGISLDPVKNRGRRREGDIRDVSTPFSRTKVLVAPTNEESMIAVEATEVAGVMADAIAAAKAARVARTMLPSLPRSPTRPPSLPPPPPKRRHVIGSLGRAVYVDGVGPTAAEELGLLSQVTATAPRIGYFRPFCDADDRKLLTMRTVFQLTSSSIDAMRGMSASEATAMLAAGREDECMDVVISKFVDYARDKDFVLVSRGHLGAIGDPHWTAKVAGALGLPVVYVLHEPRDDDKEIVLRAKDALDQRRVRLAGVVATTRDEEAARNTLENMGVFPAALLPPDERFSQITMAEIAATLEARVAFGHADLASSTMRGVIVATRHVAECIDTLRKLPPGQLVVTHAARADLVHSLVLAHQTIDYFPPIAGLLLSGTDGAATEHHLDASPDDAAQLAKTLDLLSCVPSTVRVPPILCVSESTYEAANAVHEMTPVMLPSSTAKIEAAQLLFETYLDPDFRDALADLRHDAAIVTPRMFQHHLFAKARAAPQRIVLPEGEDRRVVMAAGQLISRKVCDVTILGNPETVKALASEARVDVDGARIVDTHGEPPPPELVKALVDARKHKGMTYDVAAGLLRDDANYYGTMLLHLGLADGMVSGACHSTASTMRPALQIIKMAPGFSIVSSVFFMLLADGVKVFGDCAINVSPSAVELAQIAAASALTARAFGIDPRIAMLSYATGDSNKGDLIDKVRDATRLARDLAPDDLFEGPIQFDAAVDPAVAAVKYNGEQNPVAGVANVCIFPTLDAGNSAYKAVQQASKCIAIGPVMQGLKKPVNDLSRGCTVSDIVNTVAVTCLQSLQAKKK
ncbi:hypothetical protein CTAYLR_009197 [Chrysophaeum taylorii]|uniref:Probable acetate kinase n=1 Tax=Chrysophaeum taylorii TaxID=2483200 RepID=A0AAD7ULR0_9STRA|nr:hypothetical protein CTAYLR_009197 [Chrysophaeum taylorii]